MIQSEQATVFRGGGRRWFTALAAARAESREKIKERCECNAGDHITGPEYCYYHDDVERYARLKNRMAKFYLRAFKRKRSG